MFHWIDSMIDYLFGYSCKLHSQIVEGLTVQAVNKLATEREKVLCIMLDGIPKDNALELLAQTNFLLVENSFSVSTNCEMLFKDKKNLDIDSIQLCTGIIILVCYGATTFSELDRLLETANLAGKRVLGLIGVSKKERVKV